MGNRKIVQPGGVIGMLGGGQLGRMSIMAGRHMGYRFQVYEPKAGCAAGAVADKEHNFPYQDLAALQSFARQVDQITLEFENIPLAAVEAIEECCKVYPRGEVLHICQNRRREKEFLSTHNFPCAAYRVVNSASELAVAVAELGVPCVLKTADFGYDGKGQLKIENAESDYDAIWNNLGYSVGVLEQWVDYQTELSIIVAANGLGEFKTFPLTENIHRNHILHMSIAPARVPPVVQAKAHDLACEIANSLQCVGLLAVEMFLCKDGNLLVNELAPRPHNSGHWTLDACATSQFEQHIRAVCGMPLGLCDSLKPAVMVNILGDAWHGERSPNWVKLLKNPGTNLHLYDKGEPRIARKMGHFTVLNNDLGEAIEHASCIFREMGAGS